MNEEYLNQSRSTIGYKDETVIFLIKSPPKITPL